MITPIAMQKSRFAVVRGTGKVIDTTAFWGCVVGVYCRHMLVYDVRHYSALGLKWMAGKIEPKEHNIIDLDEVEANESTHEVTSDQKVAEGVPTDKYTYTVAWSAEDDAYVARVAEFPSLGAHDDSAEAALAQIKSVVEMAVCDLEEML